MRGKRFIEAHVGGLYDPVDRSAEPRRGTQNHAPLTVNRKVDPFGITDDEAVQSNASPAMVRRTCLDFQRRTAQTGTDLDFTNLQQRHVVGSANQLRARAKSMPVTGRVERLIRQRHTITVAPPRSAVEHHINGPRARCKLRPFPRRSNPERPGLCALARLGGIRPPDSEGRDGHPRCALHPGGLCFPGLANDRCIPPFPARDPQSGPALGGCRKQIEELGSRHYTHDIRLSNSTHIRRYTGDPLVLGSPLWKHTHWASATPSMRPSKSWLRSL